MITFFDASVAMPARNHHGESSTALVILESGYMLSALYDWNIGKWVAMGVSEAFNDENIQGQPEITEKVLKWAPLNTVHEEFL